MMSRRRKILAWTGGAVVGLGALVLFAAPPIISSVARGRIVASINESIDGTAALDRVSFSWFGATTLEGLTVRDRKGEAVLSVRHIAATPSLFSVMRGRYVADVVVTEPVIAARRDESGRVNVQSLAKPRPATETSKPLPYVKASVRVRGGRLRIDDIEFTDLKATLDVDSFDKPIRFDAELRGLGTIVAKGEVTIAGHGAMTCTLTDVPLAPFVRDLAGTVRGRADAKLAGRAVTGTADLEIADALTVAVTASGTEDSITGSMTANAKLKGLAETAAALIRLRTGHSVGGTAAWKMDFMVEGRRKLSATVDGRVTDFSATDDRGRALPLDREVTLAAKFEVDTAGLVRVEHGELKSGSITASARGGADLRARTFSDSFFKLDADLDDLAKKLSTFMELPVAIGGKVRVDATMQGTGEIAKTSATAVLSGLRVNDIGPVDLTAVVAGTADLRAGARSVFDRIEVRSEVLHLDATAETTDLSREGRLTFSAKATPSKLGYPIGGTVAATGDVEFRGTDAIVRLRASSGELAVRDLIVRDLACKLEAAKRGHTIEVPALNFASSVGHGMGRAVVKDLRTVEVHFDLRLVSAQVREIVLKERDYAIDAVVDAKDRRIVSSTVVSRDLDGRGIEVKASGSLAGGFRADLTYAPDGGLSAYGRVIEGDPIKVGVDLGIDGETYSAKGSVRAPRIAAAGIEQRDVVVDFDVVYAKEVVLRALRCRSTTGAASVTGTLDNLHIVADAELAQVAKDFKLKDYDVRGSANLVFDMKGSKVTGTGTVANFAVGTVAEPKIEFAMNADVATERMDVVLNSAELKASFVRGTVRGSVLNLRAEPAFRGLKGELVYVPEPLGAVLKPWLPGKMTGTEERKVTFTLDGRASEYNLMSILRGSTGTGTVSIGSYAVPMFALQGDMTWELKDGHALSKTSLDLNRGKASLTSDLDLRDSGEAVSTTKVELRDIEANQALSVALAYFHPVFAMAEGTVDASVAGRVDLVGDFSYRRPLKADELTNGWAPIPKRAINGKGRLEVRSLKLVGSTLVKELLKVLAFDSLEELALDPIDFTIVDGWITYDKAVPMRITDIMTSWTGRIGLDQKLDLVWEIPVTGKLLERYAFLKWWTTIRVAVSGTVTSPKLKWDDLLADLAVEAATKVVAEKKDDVMDDVLGSRNEKGAKDLLEKADRLWNEGKKAEAAPLYKKIRDDYDKTRTYKDNKDRIKQRMTGN